MMFQRIVVPSPSGLKVQASFFSEFNGIHTCALVAKIKDIPTNALYCSISEVFTIKTLEL
jgi:hypothetical protein